MPISAGMGALIGGAATGIGGIASGILGSNAAESAAQTQAQSAANALGFQQQVYGNAQGYLNPFVTTGQGANSSLASLFGLNGQPANYSSFYNSPNYQFALQQGQNATQNLAAKTGTLQSGAGLQSLENFGQGLASQQYGNYVNQLMGLSGQGVQAGSALAGTGSNMANTIGNTTMAQGQAQAAGTVGSANAWNSAIQNLTKGLQTYSQTANLGGASSYGSGSVPSWNSNPGNGAGGLSYPQF